MARKKTPPNKANKILKTDQDIGRLQKSSDRLNKITTAIVTASSTVVSVLY